MKIALASALVWIAVSAIYILNLFIAGHSFPSTQWTITALPQMWQRAVVCGVFFSMTNIMIAVALRDQPVWGPIALIVAGVVIPAAVCLWLAGARLNAEIAMLVLAISGLAVWLGIAVDGAAK